jgi:hypothetical protein
MKIVDRLTRRLFKRKPVVDPQEAALRGLSPYLAAVGWFDSVATGRPVDADRQPLPWYTYPCLSFMGERIDGEMRVFEYGSGNSTLWWSQRVASVVACEHDKPWFDEIGTQLPENVDYRYCELEYGGEYGRLISGFVAEFDCVVIDGRDRVNCARHSLGALKPGGVIVWDNSDRACYQEGFDFLRDNGFRRIDFWGLGPINAYPWCTSIFYRDGNCLGL